ncbi:DUF3662 and FHA domain-containing protein [Acidiferrimicrobium sp. IK]|uniref:FhaA domain-containing protein n=1 Tax=Acidiferrimicrobium sp. IK TaxID=2871700 RepID=UPI0021CB266B|nr:DUF3662 and FHA domain-containing protein [Acidiferrimicrobium sp. IK]MCU4186115.1 DUF3662 and FHA domain-containing protein [Acidiferrimicrobium sp. IK]
MGLQQFERRLERLVEGVFAKAFRSGLQPVEVGRRLTREMDLRRTVAPRGTLTPNRFVVLLSPEDHDRFAPIEEELIAELVSQARDHARSENYVFIGPVTVTLDIDHGLSPGMCLVAGEMVRPAAGAASLVLPDGRRVAIGNRPVTLGRLPECEVVLADPNVSRRHAEVRAGEDGGYVVRDLGSTNGTRRNGVIVNGVERLAPGDEITVGASTVRFEV